MIPRKDAIILSRADDAEFRRAWRKRIVDHDGNQCGEGGIERWIQLAEATGPDRARVMSCSEILPGVRFAVEAYLDLVSHGFLEAVASSLTELFSYKLIALRIDRLQEQLRIDFVPPDYYGSQPKACMGGWASQMLIIDPTGRVLPCHAGGVIPSLNFDSVREKSLRWIWTDSPAMNKFRGDEWMAEPCRSCERKPVDFGGCRCQAFLLTGNASNADPVCTLSPHHDLVKSIAAAESTPTCATTAHAGDPTSTSPSAWVYRISPKADAPHADRDRTEASKQPATRLSRIF